MEEKGKRIYNEEQNPTLSSKSFSEFGDRFGRDKRNAPRYGI